MSLRAERSGSLRRHMGRVRVKICGITQKKDLMTAVEVGADAVGFVVNVPASSRNLTIKKAKRLMEQNCKQ